MLGAFSELCEVTERALAHTEKEEVLIVGGVAASKALRGMMEKMCTERNAGVFVPEMQYCVDNGAMIAWQGMLEHKAGTKTKLENSSVRQKFRADDVKVNWI